MADDFIVEGIKLFGGIAGLLTAAFTLYDRLIRNRPIVDLYATQEWEGVGAHVYARVRNVNDRAIVITECNIDRDRIRLIAHESTLATVEAMSGHFSATVIAAKAVKSFRIGDLRARLSSELRKRCAVHPALVY